MFASCKGRLLTIGRDCLHGQVATNVQQTGVLSMTYATVDFSVVDLPRGPAHSVFWPCPSSVVS